MTSEPAISAAVQPAVQVEQLAKKYPKSPVNAVDGISFNVAAGEVFGLLGPNGAGKTTTVGVLTTRVRPTRGTALVGGIDVVRNPVQARRLLAVIPQRNNLDRSLSIRNNLIFHAAYHGVGASDRGRRADELLNQFGLLERARSKPDFFSGGQAQRVMIARALMHAPRVLFLDEPTTGLDPAARLFVWDRLRELRQGGVTLLLTTHDMEEAAALADRVGIMDRGKLLALDTPAALTRSLPGQSTLELTTGTAPAAEHDLLMKDLAALHGVERVEEVPVASSNGGAPTGPWSGAGSSSAAETAPGSAGGGPAPLRVRLYLSVDAPSLVAPAAGVLTGHHLVLADVRIGAPSLEDVFIHLTGRTLR